MNATMNDAGIKHAVERELAWDTGVDEAEVGVTVEERIVTLSGRVASYAEKLAAERAAHRVPGVLDVANDIVVKVPHGLSLTDADIARAVRHALEWDVLVPHERIRSTVRDAWVELDGEVERISQRETAEHAVERLAGVRGVTNKIVVHAPHVEPGAVRSSIAEALARHATREAGQIAITVADGIVTLEGHVASWPEKRAVIGVVSHAPGVRAVNDRLAIRP